MHFPIFLYLSISDLFARSPEKELINQYFQWQGTQNQPNRGNILMLCCAIICLYENGKKIMLLKWWKISMIAAAIWGSQRSSSLMKRSRHLCPALNMALSSSSFSSILSDLPSLSSFPLLSSLSSSSISSSLSSSSYQKPTCYIPHRHLLIRTTWSFQKYLYHHSVGLPETITQFQNSHIRQCQPGPRPQGSWKFWGKSMNLDTLGIFACEDLGSSNFPEQVFSKH